MSRHIQQKRDNAGHVQVYRYMCRGREKEDIPENVPPELKNAEKKFQQNLPGTIIGKTSENVPAEKEQGTFSLKNYKERS